MTTIVAIGGSAGSIEVLRSVVASLNPKIDAAFFVVVHIPSGANSVLPKLLTRDNELVAVHPRDGEAIKPGHIYVAPPGHHLLVEPGPSA